MSTETRKSPLMTTVLLTAAACFVYMISCGIRNNFGVMLNAITEHAGLTYASVSFVLAVGQFCFGLTQPFSGIIADKKGNRFSLLSGILCTVVSVALLPFCRSQATLMLVLGIVLPGGLGMISYGLVVSTISPRLPDASRTMVSGIINASSGVGNTLLTPIISGAIVAGGLTRGAGTLTVLALLMIPITLLMCGRGGGKKAAKAAAQPEDQRTVGELAREAVRNRDYLFIVLGFFTCGFHMALITNHLPTEIMSYGYTYEQSAGAFSVYGVATITGALLTGAICSRLRMKNVLGVLYGSRTVWTVLFFLLPKTLPVIYAYIILLGATGAATVSPVSGICRRLFGQRGVSIFFGVAFVAHQIGGFLSSWLGGLCYEATGAYAAIWTVDAVFCAVAALVSFLIRAKNE